MAKKALKKEVKKEIEKILKDHKKDLVDLKTRQERMIIEAEIKEQIDN